MGKRPGLLEFFFLLRVSNRRRVEPTTGTPGQGHRRSNLLKGRGAGRRFKTDPKERPLRGTCTAAVPRCAPCSPPPGTWPCCGRSYRHQPPSFFRTCRGKTYKRSCRRLQRHLDWRRAAGLYSALASVWRSLSHVGRRVRLLRFESVGSLCPNGSSGHDPNQGFPQRLSASRFPVSQLSMSLSCRVS